MLDWIPDFTFVFSPERAIEIISPLSISILSIVVYAMFVYNFYKYLGKRNIFELDLQQYNRSETPGLSKIYHILLYFVEHILLLPLIVFFWFIILTSIIVLLTEASDVAGVSLIAMALVGGVRITAYYHQELSKDLAKLLPYGLLAVFLGKINFLSISFSSIVLMFKEMILLYDTLVYYMIFIIGLEIALRIIFSLMAKKEPQPQAIQE